LRSRTPDDEAGDAVGLVDGQIAVGELDRLVDVAVREREMKARSSSSLFLGSVRSAER
jgi:hypothetical protein